MTKNHLPVYLVNMAHDIERRTRCNEQLAAIGVHPHLIPAYNGHQEGFPFHKYRHLSRGKWWHRNVFKPGAFACYLSHARCWSEIAAADNGYGLVLEDDIIIDKQAFADFEITLASFDIIFVNWGVRRLLDHALQAEGEPGSGMVALNELLVSLLEQGEFSDNLTPGAYGYIVSKRGASKLLAIMEREKICMGVDYAMIFGAFRDRDIETIRGLEAIPSYVQDYLDNIGDSDFYEKSERITLDAYVSFAPALVSHNDSGESRLQHGVFREFDVFNYSPWQRMKNIFKKR